MNTENFAYGIIGLGTMGRNILLNMNDHGYDVAGFDKDKDKIAQLKLARDAKSILGTTSLKEFITSLKQPRVILMLVPAGKIVDAVIEELKPFLGKEDLLLDCGNSHFTDTDRRIEQLKKSSIHFMGVGISGGEFGARNGPSIMPGGNKASYERVQKVLEAISAKVNGEPCVTWLGPGSAGHYVKMVHNGIEYGIMELIAESYHILKVIGKLTNEELHTVFSNWNKGILHSFLIQITGDIFSKKDELTRSDLIDKILDSAQQKGTGAWTSEDAMKIQVPIPVIDAAVGMRNLSGFRKEREVAHEDFNEQNHSNPVDKNELIRQMEQALYFSMIVTYAQGFELLKAASKEYQYNLVLPDIAKIWRGGCIIRASLLEDITAAFSTDPNLSNLITAVALTDKVEKSQTELRKVVQYAVTSGIPIPALMSAISYYDSYRSSWLPANLLQAQRDYFGAHTYERNDRAGVFHTNWNQTTD